MKYTKIFPAAAGVIALTATVCFARDLRENEDSDFVQMRIVERSGEAESSIGKRIPGNSKTVAIDSETGRVYLVEVRENKHIHEVEIDARTGKVIGLRTLNRVKA